MAAKKKKARAKTGSKAKKGRKPAKRKAARKPAKRKVAAKRKAAPKRKVAAKRKAAPKKRKAAPKLAVALAPSVERLKFGATEMGQSAMDAGRVLVDEAKEAGREAQDKIKDITTDWFNRG